MKQISERGVDMACEHKWVLSDEDFQRYAISRYRADDTDGNCYISKFLIHYWEETVCEKCGQVRLVSTTLDRKDVTPISDYEFNMFNAFLTQLNKRSGYVDTKLKLTNYALDCMPWRHPPQFLLHNPDYNYFYLSFDGDPRDEDPNKRFDWDFYEAVELIGDIRKMSDVYYDVNKMEQMQKEQGLDFENMIDADTFQKILKMLNDNENEKE